MLSHVYIGIGDFQRAFDFYSPLLKGLGLTLKFSDASHPWAGWVSPTAPRPLFIIGGAIDGQPATPGHGQMIALLAETRADVDQAHATAMANSGTCEGPPGLRPQYHADYYGAYFRDPDGNKLCVCCHRGGVGQAVAGRAG